MQVYSAACARWKDSDSYYARFWRKRLYNLYERTGQKEKLGDLALQLVRIGETGYYDEARAFLQEEGRWENARQELQSAVRGNLQLYMFVLAKGGETELLLPLVRRWQRRVFEYGYALYPEYPEEMTRIALNQIRKLEQKAKSRDKYERMGYWLERLAAMGARETALRVLDELCEKYQKKRAFLEELQWARERIEKQAP